MQRRRPQPGPSSTPGRVEYDESHAFATLQAMHRDAPAGIFNTQQAAAAGWSGSALSRAARSGRLTRLRRGIYCVGERDPVSDAVAASAMCCGSVISHESAALLHGIALLGDSPLRPRLTVEPYGTGDVAGALLHRAGLPVEHVCRRDTVRVTTPARTVVDLGRSTALAGAVVAMDSAMSAGLADLGDIEAVLARCAHWPYARRAAHALMLADPNAESPLETISRLVLRQLRLPVPRTQAAIRDPRGFVIARCDFYWDEFGVAGEADGRSKYDDREVLTSEKRRQEALEDLGIVVVRWGWPEVRIERAHLRARIQAAFERGRLRDQSGFPRAWSVGAS